MRTMAFSFLFFLAYSFCTTADKFYSFPLNISQQAYVDMVLVIVTYVEKILMEIFEFHETGCLQ